MGRRIELTCKSVARKAISKALRVAERGRKQNVRTLRRPLPRDPRPVPHRLSVAIDSTAANGASFGMRLN